MYGIIFAVGLLVLSWIFGEQYRMVTHHEVDEGDKDARAQAR